ncbi:hypothetical protein [Psychroserpens mesophilus]|uniref:hypothetical protein n=1 Tax=Psychroserpens mesophilus TaxID=325473 RepID=UPI000590C09D|nr:hypothetical protein [Psychroserpens mesophilus]
MKTAFTILFLFLATISVAQSQNSDHSKKIQVTKVTDFKISVVVNSLNEIKRTFTMNDIKDILNDLPENENVSFEMICNGKEMSDNKKSSVSYKVMGNVDDRRGFLKTIEKVRQGAINYYKSK